MIKRINNHYDFIKEFENYGRGNQFTPYGFKALYEYLEEVFEDYKYELDVIGLCVEFTQYDSIKEAVSDYIYTIEKTFKIDDNTSDEELHEALSYFTTVISCYDGSVIVQNI